MPHRHRVRDIADQAGLSEATVDRVLHHRPGVSVRATRAVHRAIADLDRQAGQLVLTGRSLVADLVMAAPDRFSDVVRAAFEAEAAMLRPAQLRLRYDLDAAADPAWIADRLARLARRGSDGILLKAPDDPVVAEAVDAVVAAGIPVITLVTDLPTTARHVYVGIDNQAAGATAAYLLNLAAGPGHADEASPDVVTTNRGAAPGPGELSQVARSGAARSEVARTHEARAQEARSVVDALVPLSRAAFLGEGQRAQGFVDEFTRLRPGSRAVVLDGTDGLDETMERLAAQALADDPGLALVYSPGGANRGTLAAFDAARRPVRGFVAHDLDEDNLVLLRSGRLTAVLHHDLRRDARRSLGALLQVQGLLPGRPVSLPRPVVVVTPHNIPL
ncbi:LacI family transcriptional regulator [Kineosphaera limosa]|uniref:Putative LacI family transcriptional regulator n=1 Tax=Kineosphaera limosa NBRC 100340 TaxID=1184609 RepID=K6WTP5_9MICO|nr:LacI family DNA-binding transcriptional regulator [Kineosphaera limosa]NYE01099.1 LacI family transcriptional regulator [Kineosphaera limosa]GAB97226.1 putative LacI family transcriptional regulator [Kineosphaera limosa NBRC 100340]